jgi:inhibitor of KinA sporulation pathway (predicted exonuclease)
VNTFRQYLALDLELNTGPDPSMLPAKIIQVGVAWGSWDHYTSNSINTASWFVNPQEPIFPRITELTGITDQDVQEKSTPVTVIAKELGDIIEGNSCFVNPVTWGGGDSDSLLNLFRREQVGFPYFGRRWIDVKTWHIFHMLSQGKDTVGGLSKGMSKYGIQFEGKAHRADVDAKNTLRLFFKMLDKQSVINLAVEMLKGVK